MLKVKWKKMTDHPEFQMPRKAYKDDSGYDLVYWGQKNIELQPGETKLIPLGVAVGLPKEHELQIRSRSGLSLKEVVVANSPGTVDNGWTDECSAIIKNNGSTPFKIEPKMKICQGVVAHVPPTEDELVDSLDETERADKGFGSSGLKVGE